MNRHHARVCVMRPGELIDHIREVGFTTISKAAAELGVSTDEIRDAIDFLRKKRHLIRVDMTTEDDCESGSCSSCAGSGAPFAIQEDDKPVIYKLSSILSR